MYLIRICNKEIDEYYDMLSSDIEELYKIFDYIKIKPKLSLVFVKEQCFISGLDELKTIIR